MSLVKIKLPTKEWLILLSITTLATIVTIVLLYCFEDKSPIIDGFTAVFSILGMYLTVKRAIEQWIVWFWVNLLSLIMWLKIALSGVKVYSTVIMWAVYVTLAVYFYCIWRKETNNKD